MGNIIYGAAMGLLALLGLTLASGAEDFGFKLFAWLLVAFGLVMIFTLINQATGAKDPH